MKKFNRLLTRQIKRTLGGMDKVPPEMLELLEKVNDSYEHFEEDRRLLDRAMDISSEELREANDLLRAESKKQMKILEQLRDVLTTLWSVSDKDIDYKAEVTIAGNEDLLEIANMLKKQSHRIKEVEEELSYANKELKNFAYIVSHDLKAPLRAVGSLTDWLVTDYSDKLGDEGKEYLHLIKMRINRLNNLIEGILQYSRAGKRMARIVPVDLNQTVDEAIFLLNPPEHFEIQIQENLPTILSDSTKMRQVFQNLISNAIKYNDKKIGKLNIGFEEKADCLYFFVADNGPGIESKYHDKIFDIFQTLHARDDVESTGVGLTVVKKIIEGSQGNIWLTSKITEGTTFYFSFPSKLKYQASLEIIHS